MITLLCLLWVAAGACFWLGIKDYGHGGAIIASLVLGFLLVIPTLSSISMYVEYRPNMAQLSTTRAAVERLGCTASEDVLGKAVEYNEDIITNRVWRDRLGSLVPAEWDTVTTIAIPECAR